MAQHTRPSVPSGYPRLGFTPAKSIAVGAVSLGAAVAATLVPPPYSFWPVVDSRLLIWAGAILLLGGGLSQFVDADRHWIETVWRAGVGFGLSLAFVGLGQTGLRYEPGIAATTLSLLGIGVGLYLICLAAVLPFLEG